MTSRCRQRLKQVALCWICLTFSLYIIHESFTWITKDFFELKSPYRIHIHENVSGPQFLETDSDVDLRIVVLTYKRASSLKKLLRTLNQLELDGDTAIIEIFIDREKHSNRVAEEVVNLAKTFPCKLGPVRTHVQIHHAGIYGQWINSWNPKTHGGMTFNISEVHRGYNSAENISRLSSTSSPPILSSYQRRWDEMVLILEDDLSISPYAYQWLKAARTFYQNRPDIAGITLQCENINVASTGVPLKPQSHWGPAYMYSLVGSWGFMPNPQVWKDFQKWYRNASLDSAFHPYVEGLIMTTWYKEFEKSGTTDTMWTMWFIYYCYQHRLFTLYANLKGRAKSSRHCLAVNRKEPGLHFSGKPIENEHRLVQLWSDEFVNFSKSPIKIDFFGRHV